MSQISISIILVVIFLAPINTYALSSSENTELSRFLVELKALDRIIVIAEHSENKADRFQFDYQQLRKDLLKIHQGVTEHINPIRRDPRVLPEVEGSY
jgi:RAQPRD family integrative conjugative element protein